MEKLVRLADPENADKVIEAIGLCIDAAGYEGTAEIWRNEPNHRHQIAVWLGGLYTEKLGAAKGQRMAELALLVIPPEHRHWAGMIEAIRAVDGVEAERFVAAIEAGARA